MTLPGIVQALLVLVASISAFVMYFRRYPKQTFVPLIGGGLFILIGFIIIEINWNPPPSLSDVWKFRPTDFYQGTILVSVGAGIVVGNLGAWVVSCVLRALKKPN